MAPPSAPVLRARWTRSLLLGLGVTGLAGGGAWLGLGAAEKAEVSGELLGGPLESVRGQSSARPLVEAAITDPSARLRESGAARDVEIDRTRRGEPGQARTDEMRGAPQESSGSMERDPKEVLREIPVVLYKADWCPSCRKARAFLTARSIPFREYDVDTDELARERAHVLNPARTIPVIQIDERILVGFSEGEVVAALSDSLSVRVGRRVDVTVAR